MMCTPHGMGVQDKVRKELNASVVRILVLVLVLVWSCLVWGAFFPAAALRRHRNGHLALLAVRLGGRRDARARHGLEQALDVRRAAREGVTPEVVPRVFDEFDEGDEQAPRMWAVHDEPLQQHLGFRVEGLGFRV